MVTLVNEKVLDATVASGILAAPGPMFVSTWLSSATEGVMTSLTANHYALTSSVVGICPRQTYLETARTGPYYGVAHVNDGVTYCAPQRIMICCSVLLRHIRRRGLYVSDKVTSRSRRDCVDVTSLYSRREKSSGKKPKYR